MLSDRNRHFVHLLKHVDEAIKNVRVLRKIYAEFVVEHRVLGATRHFARRVARHFRQATQQHAIVACAAEHLVNGGKLVQIVGRINKLMDCAEALDLLLVPPREEKINKNQLCTMKVIHNIFILISFNYGNWYFSRYLCCCNCLLNLTKIFWCPNFCISVACSAHALHSESN